jgi:hypothetical protein
MVALLSKLRLSRNNVVFQRAGGDGGLTVGDISPFILNVIPTGYIRNVNTMRLG